MYLKYMAKFEFLIKKYYMYNTNFILVYKLYRFQYIQYDMAKYNNNKELMKKMSDSKNL